MRVEIANLVVEFPAVRALDGVSVSFEPGVVHAIVGENGAGKSTLMKVLSGLLQPTSGEVRLDGKTVRLPTPRSARDAGVAMIHQELNLVDELEVAANIFLGEETTKFGRLDDRAMREKAKPYLVGLKAPFEPDSLVGDLPVAAKQIVEIAKALAAEASVIVMDEPTAILSPAEAEGLFESIRNLRSKGATVIYISHRLEEVVALADRVTVLRDGQLVTTLNRGQADEAALASLMVGRPLSDMFPPRREVAGSEPLLQASNLSDGDRVLDASVDVRPGEIVGLAGLVGSGRTELAEIIVGARASFAGSIKVAGRQISPRNVREALREGLAYVSEDRKGLGLFQDLSSVENVSIASLEDRAKPFVNAKAEIETTKKWVRALDIRVGDIEAPISTLSGGNQQKVSLARWLECEPRVLILDEPTRGVDVGAKAEIYRLIHKLAGEGKACLVISSEINELLGLCNRIVVMHRGRTVGEVDGATATEESVMALASGLRVAA